MGHQTSNAFTGIHKHYQSYERQKCFIAFTERVDWAGDLLDACQEVLCRPEFNLEPDYAGRHLILDAPLRQKALELIANARYGIYDLSYWRDEKGSWQVPRNVFIEFGMAIALNRPTLLLRHASNQELDLPECLKSVGEHILVFSGQSTLKHALKERLPQWINALPEQGWWNRHCIFGGRVCEYRETHPRARQWGQKKLSCHISDGLDIDRADFRNVVEEVLERFNDITYKYLDGLSEISGYNFLLCSHCQTVRSTPFAVYRISRHTLPETFIAIGMSTALEAQFEYTIPKLILTEDPQDVPSLLAGYEVVVARSDSERKMHLRRFMPTVVQKVRETVWKPRPLPFIDPGTRVEQFSFDESLKEKEESEKKRLLGLLNRSVDELEISVRAYNLLKEYNIRVIKDIVRMSKDEFRALRGSTVRDAEEITEILQTFGLNFGMDLLSLGLATSDEPGAGRESAQEVLDRSIDELELTVRTYNCLRNANIKNLGDLTQKTESELLSSKNFGKKSLKEVKEILSEMGLSLRAEQLPIEPLSDEPRPSVDNPRGIEQTLRDKVRIYDLAKELKMESKRIIDEVRREGVDVSVPSNTISPQIAEKIRNKYFPKKQASTPRTIHHADHAAPNNAANVRLYVGNLPFSTSSGELSNLFAQAGTVVLASIVEDRNTGRSRGFGFVEMATPQEAAEAIGLFNGKLFEGRALTVNEARPRTDTGRPKGSN